MDWRDETSRGCLSTRHSEASGVGSSRTLRLCPLPPFTGLKRYLGHTLGACGAVELAAFLGCLRAGFIPPTAGCAQPDPELRVTPLAVPQPARPGPVMFNFFGFGGNYASLIVSHG